MKTLLKTCLLLLTLLFGIAAFADTASAQATGKKTKADQPGAKLTGTVIDQDTQDPVSNAWVYVEQDSMATDKEGRFSFTMVKPGEHTVLVKAEGYNDWSQTVTLLPEKQAPKMLTVKLTPSDE